MNFVPILLYLFITACAINFTLELMHDRRYKHAWYLGLFWVILSVSMLSLSIIAKVQP